MCNFFKEVNEYLETLERSDEKTLETICMSENLNLILRVKYQKKASKMMNGIEQRNLILTNVNYGHTVLQV